MKTLQLENRLKQASTREDLMAAARQIRQFAPDSSVLDALCDTAVETKHYDVREALIDMLQNNAEEANIRFINYAKNSPDPNRRRWAFVNLSLMECRTAKVAVLKGLRDPDSEVRIAAALNAGLYDDHEVLAALKHFFATSRFACVQDFTDLIFRKFRQNKRPKMTLDVACLQDALHSQSAPSV